MFLASPWIVGGDFNMITSLNEKRGGLIRIDADMEAFGDMIAEQRLLDIQTTNGIYTWNNRRGGRHQIASKLDKLLLLEHNINWDIFIEAMILPGMGSDHWPIKIELHIKANPKEKPFRFKAFWLRDQNFMMKVEEWWKQSRQRGRNKMQTFQLKLKELKGNIKNWNKEEFGNIFKDQQLLDQKMKKIQQEIITVGRSEGLAREEGILIGQMEERRK